MLAAHRRTVVVLSALLAVGFASVGTPSARAAVQCDRYAAPTGSDAADGTLAAPFRTAGKLVQSLTPNQSGCLLPGTYPESLTIRNGGAPGAPITLSASPQGGATIAGRLWVTDAANDVVVRELTLDGRNTGNLPSPSVNGDRISFIGNDVSNSHTTICFNVGSVTGYGLAENVLLEGNRIHNCGVLPAQNHHHGIYLENSRNGVIRGNFIFDNADKGILIFPDSDGNLVEQNVIDGNTTGILVGGSMLADAWHAIYPKDNLIRRNVITNSRRYNIEGYWEWQPPADVNNVVTDNCLFGGGMGQVQDPTQVSVWGAGFSAVGNRVADPAFVSRQNRNFGLASSTGCAGFGPGVATAAPAPVPNPVPAPAQAPAPAPVRSTPKPPAPKNPPRAKRPRQLQGAGTQTPIRIVFAGRPKLTESGRLAVRVAAAPNARIVVVVRARGRILAVVRTRSGKSGGVVQKLALPRGGAKQLRVTASVLRGRQLRRTTLAVRLTDREVSLLAARR